MTCILGLEHNGVAYIGADSVGVDGWVATICTEPKVFECGKMIIGFTTSFRMGQLLQYVFEPPITEAPVDESYFVKLFIPALKACFEEHGFGKKGGEVGDEGGEFLIGAEGKLFVIQGNYQIVRPRSGIFAAGVGREFAVGALQAQMDLVLRGDTSEMQAIERALAISAQYSIGVRPPFKVLCNTAKNQGE